MDERWFEIRIFDKILQLVIRVSILMTRSDIMVFAKFLIQNLLGHFICIKTDAKFVRENTTILY